MDSKISALNSATVLTDADVLPIVNGAETKKVSVSVLKTNIRTGLALTSYVDSQDALKVDKIAGSRLITSSESIIIGNTSGTNSGDETTSSIKSKLGVTTLSGSNTGDDTTATIKSKLGITTLSGDNTGDQDLTNLVVKNTAITGETKTKITYDNKGLVTSGADATTADIADSTNKRYVTDANLTTIGNQSGVNTGDETQSTILSKLAYYNYKNTSSSTSISALTDTPILQLTIPANTFSASDIIRISAVFVKTGVLNTATIRFKMTTSTSLPSGTTSQIAQFNTSAANLFVAMDRRYTLKSGNITGFPFLSPSVSDYATSNTTLGSQAFDPTVTNYLWVSGNVSNVLDSIYMSSIQITNI